MDPNSPWALLPELWTMILDLAPLPQVAQWALVCKAWAQWTRPAFTVPLAWTRASVWEPDVVRDWMRAELHRWPGLVAKTRVYQTPVLDEIELVCANFPPGLCHCWTIQVDNRVPRGYKITVWEEGDVRFKASGPLRRLGQMLRIMGPAMRRILAMEDVPPAFSNV